ncbi:amino acid ABC transporter permease [Gulosibacter macacae]|uniref:Amino acid ABC transporter permease n=1 Tax=Gulosibacter macacae TaxID=2488791 RepID=A0A3P3VXQ7_9MICO|nr:amino acid ABC transporter permease [Gulosibacter macacae]RRJ87480.1 amino acid ABC transporter permease [Gulosibacter macacae]
MESIIDFGAIGSYALQLIPYIPVTLALAVLATAFGIIVGLVFALIKMARTPVLSQIAAVIVSYLRGTPILVQLLLNINAMPIFVIWSNQTFGTNWDALALSPFIVATFTFALNEAAYASETIRASLLSVDRREIEAAQSLGMTPWQTLTRITIPNATVVAFPTLVNHFIGMLKQSSLAFVVSVIEITAFAKILGGRDYRYFEAYLATAIVYWAMTVIVEQITRRMEARLSLPTTGPRKRKGQVAAAPEPTPVGSAAVASRVDSERGPA